MVMKHKLIAIAHSLTDSILTNQTNKNEIAMLLAPILSYFSNSLGTPTLLVLI